MYTCRLLDWKERRSDGVKKNKFDKIIIFKQLFHPKEFEVRTNYKNLLVFDGAQHCVVIFLRCSGGAPAN